MFKQKPKPNRIDKLEKLSLFQMYSGKTKTKKHKVYNFLWKAFWVILAVLVIYLFFHLYGVIVTSFSKTLS